jgi:hypothetical protein
LDCGGTATSSPAPTPAFTPLFTPKGASQAQREDGRDLVECLDLDAYAADGVRHRADRRLGEEWMEAENALRFSQAAGRAGLPHVQEQKAADHVRCRSLVVQAHAACERAERLGNLDERRAATGGGDRRDDLAVTLRRDGPRQHHEQRHDEQEQVRRATSLLNLKL